MDRTDSLLELAEGIMETGIVGHKEFTHSQLAYHYGEAIAVLTLLVSRERALEEQSEDLRQTLMNLTFANRKEEAKDE